MRTFNKKEDAPRGSWVRVNGSCKSQTEKAICFNTEGASVWLPKSQMFCIDNGVTAIHYHVKKWCLAESKIKVS